MAVQNYLTNYTDKYTVGSPLKTGVEAKEFEKTISIAAADDDGSTYLIYKNMPTRACLSQLLLEVDAMTGATSYDIGFYDSVTGLVINDNLCMSAADIHSGSTKLSPIDGLSALTHTQTSQTIADLLSENLKDVPGCVDLVLTADTVGSGAGSITFRGKLKTG